MSAPLSHAPAAATAAAPAHSIPYVKLWYVLVGALGVSLLLAGFEHHRLAAALIFAIAIAKAAIVAMYYMHLRFEPRYVILVLLSGLVCLTVLFAGLLLDIVHVYGG
ncbi:MAG TPA: cytochrome C oxidase subunit IV family protein [Candidatus Eisenbacteria bacterium]|jgi:caa(3)-type oxidase subunit IV|nr:cytochrome C oxidase subunit IV family protein [Candidatus Eisenbacteria bacterium]